MNSVTVSDSVYPAQNFCTALFCCCREDILSQGLGRAKNNVNMKSSDEPHWAVFRVGFCLNGRCKVEISEPRSHLWYFKSDTGKWFTLLM